LIATEADSCLIDTDNSSRARKRRSSGNSPTQHKVRYKNKKQAIFKTKLLQIYKVEKKDK